MKKTLITALIILLTGCNLSMEDIAYKTGTKLIDTAAKLYFHQDVYYDDSFASLQNISKVRLYILNNIRYKYNPLSIYRTVEDILISGRGDCDEYALAFVNVAYVALNIECNIVTVDGSELEGTYYRPIKTPTRQVALGGYVNHVIVELPNGTLIEPQTGMVVYYPVRYRYTFKEVFDL